jgi:hypothetical protein
MSLRSRAIRLIALVAARYSTGALVPVHPIENRSNQPVNRDNEKRGHWRGHDAAKETANRHLT